MGTLYEESCVTQHHITHLVYTLYTHRYCRICTYKHPLYLYMHTIYTSVYTPLNTLYTPYIHLIYTLYIHLIYHSGTMAGTGHNGQVESSGRGIYVEGEEKGDE